MIKKRLIGVVTVKDGIAVQSFGYSHYLPLGKPEILVKNLNRWGADEILVNVIDRSIKKKGPSFDLLEKINKLNLETPIIYSGGISSLEDASEVIKKGADRIVVEGLLYNNLSELKKISLVLGSQSVIVSMPLIMNKKSNIYYYSYQKKQIEKISNNFIVAIKQKLISEILLIDCLNEGFKDKFNYNLIKKFPFKNMPLICFGGIATKNKVKKIINNKFVSAVAIGNSLNYSEHSIQIVKKKSSSSLLRKEYFY